MAPQISNIKSRIVTNIKNHLQCKYLISYLICIYSNTGRQDKSEKQVVLPKNAGNNTQSQSPVVKVSTEKEDQNISSKLGAEFSEVSKINSQKKIVSKYVEIIKKVIYTFDDGSKKEITELENHTYKD
jgi:hypothetical protein